MQRFEMDPDAELSLAVIDATLAGEAVEPEYAELAELTLILAGQRPKPSDRFASELDERVERRFAPAPAGAGTARRGRWLWAPAGALGVAATIAAVVVIGSGVHGSQSSVSSASSSAASNSALPQRASAGGSVKLGPSTQPPHALARSAHTSAAGVPSSTPAALVPTPSSTGRQIIQSAQLSLSAKPNQVDAVAQEVFNVVSSQSGVVQNSNVTAANNATGYAQFQLSVPSSNLEATMAALSKLHGASVVSRTDSTQDITAQLGGAGRRLSEGRALHTSLLKQLAAATTTLQVDSLKAQIRDVDAAISRDLSTLGGLHRQVNFSRIQVTINATPLPVRTTSHGGGFTLGKALHDAGRVLVVSLGAALIALAVLVPLAVVGGLAIWAGLAVRRRRREQALDLV